VPITETEITIEAPASQKPSRPPMQAPAVPSTRRAQLSTRVGTKDVCRLARQLSTLLHAGMPLVPALSVLQEQLGQTSKSRYVRWGDSTAPLAPIVAQIRDDVSGGDSLAEAMGKYPTLFSSLFVNMVAAGESSGTLEPVLTRLAEILEKRVQLTSKVKAALAYPMMMSLVATGVVIFLLSYVVPGITQLFTEMHRELPKPTLVLIAVSNAMRSHTVFIGVLAVAAIGGVIAFCRSPNGRIWVDRLKFGLPLFGPLFFKIEAARLTRTWGTLMKSGIPIIAAIDISRRVSQNHIILEAADTIKEGVHKGQTVADAIQSTGIFPPVVFHVIATGQTSGNVEDGLIDIADMYEAEIETSMRSLTSLLEPLILLVMGGVVGFIVLAILLPIFEINRGF
jgi:general secretion pathway protein F